MFELKYKVTDDDLKAINKKTMLFYFVLYLTVAVVAIAIGIVAVVYRPQMLMYVLGIILIVLGGILLVCALLLLIAPKNFLTSAVKPSDNELNVKVDERGIKVTVGEESKLIEFYQVRSTKVKNGLLYVYTAKDVALLVKNAVCSGGAFEELCKFVYARQRGVVNPVLAEKQQESAEQESSDKE